VTESLTGLEQRRLLSLGLAVGERRSACAHWSSSAAAVEAARRLQEADVEAARVAGAEGELRRAQEEHAMALSAARDAAEVAMRREAALKADFGSAITVKHKMKRSANFARTNVDVTFAFCVLRST